MNVFNALTFALAVVAIVPMVCRLNMLHVGKHRTSIVLLHLAMAYSVLWGGFAGFSGIATVGDFFSVLAPVLWVTISFHSWRDGVPSHYLREVQSLEYPKILDLTELQGAGGKK